MQELVLELVADCMTFEDAARVRRVSSYMYNTLPPGDLDRYFTLRRCYRRWRSLRPRRRVNSWRRRLHHPEDPCLTLG